jgi:DNA-directed RNA polymerase subunit RPC12/RpoP
MKSAGKGLSMGRDQWSGKGAGQGRGQGSGQRGGGGRNKGGAFGPGGYCVCAKCGAKLPHQRGVKCTSLKCPDCGHTMIREELLTKKK